ncbi:SAM-dependent chlorinase/fluorinase [Bacteroidales bacterium OttesenSCG-928-I21]|nr:SAM-dependent chlorinase/fluorinase [Bacteroidales bacterium OttesenSCG-928-I21]
MADIVTLTTDWHNSDYYVGSIKAAIISRVPNAVIMDISHNIATFSRQQAAFVLKNTYKNFPTGTIHIVGVDSEPKIDGNIVVAYYEKQYFICNNNGILGIVFDKTPEIVVSIDVGNDYDGSTFPEFSIFSKIACYICSGSDIKQLGRVEDDVVRVSELMPQQNENEIVGNVIYIDSFSNVITNISKDLFENQGIAMSNFEILLNSNFHKTNKIHKSYNGVDRGEIVCVFNSLNLLEVAIREGKAASLLSLDRHSLVRIKYNLQ